MKNLLPVVDKYFKTCLHTHSTVDDGHMDPAEVKERYKAAGYSVIALTDHETCFTHHELNDPDFLMLTGYEMLTNSSSARQASMASRSISCPTCSESVRFR